MPDAVLGPTETAADPQTGGWLPTDDFAQIAFFKHLEVEPTNNAA